MNGFWRGKGQAEDVVTLIDGIKAKVSENTKVRFAEVLALKAIKSNCARRLNSLKSMLLFLR